MKTIKIMCDRCGAEIEGMIGKCPDTGAIATSGYYIVAEGSSWNEYQRDDEEYVCDECMHADSEYKKLYLQE